MDLSVLVVDDDPALGDLLVTVLGEAGLRASLATSADDAEGALAGAAFDVILLDRDLPGGRDGLSLLERLRERGDEICVVIITGVSTVANAQRAMELGVSAFLAKPFADIFEVVELVRRFAGRAAERRRRRARHNHDAASLADVTAALKSMTQRLAARAESERRPPRAAVVVDDAAERALILHELKQALAEAHAVDLSSVADDLDLVVVGAPLARLVALVEAVRARTGAPILAAGEAPDMELVAKLIGLGVVAYAERPLLDVAGLRKKLAIAFRRAREGG